MKNKIIICVLVVLLVVESILLIISFTNKNNTKCKNIDETEKETKKKEENISSNGVHYSFVIDEEFKEEDYKLDFLKSFTIGGKDILSNFKLNKKDAKEYEQVGIFLDNVTEYLDGFIVLETGGYYDLLDYREAYYIFDIEGNLIEKMEPKENENSGIYGYEPTDIYYNSITKTLRYDYEVYTTEEGLLPDIVTYETKKDVDLSVWYDDGKIPKSACNAISKYLDKDIVTQYEMKYKGNGQFEKAKVINNVTLKDSYDYEYELGLCGLDD